MATDTARFNVGGKKYEISRSLLESFPNTMLARMASKTWQTDPEAAMFVDRDGERFRCILDYMRDGKVHLPLTVAKGALLLDLEYFGFENVDPACIQ
jgi:hypothetical protein